MRKQIATHFKTSNPSIGNVVASGYALGQEWYNTTTGEKFYHKTDGVWISVDTSALPTGTVTSVGLTMPSAFSVSNSPITSSGSIAVTGAGSTSQYVRGDGTLASFPDVAGGGGGQVYYFNGGISQGVIGSASYYQMSVAANVSEGVDFTSGTSSGVFANFITDTGKPTQETIPAGVWILQCYFSQSESTGTPEVSASVEVYNGATFSVLSSSLVEEITNGIAIDLYTFTVAVPEYTPLTTSDRIAIRFSVGNLSGTNTVTLHTQGPHFSSVQTTFTTGLASLDGLTSAAQYFQTGTTGSDFNIATSGTDTHVFNLPTASATKRGALSSSDWSTFNGKQDSLGFTPVAANSAITGATKTKITYDSKGLVTSGVDATTADIADSTNKRYVTDANLVVIGNISGTNSGDQTFLNPRVQSVTSSTTVTPTSTNDLVTITAQAAGLTIENPTGTMTEGQSLMIRIKDNGTARAIAFGTNYRAIGITLPTTTVISKTMYLGLIWNATDTKFDVVGLNQEA